LTARFIDAYGTNMKPIGGRFHKVNRSLTYSILDGSAFSAMAGLTQSYIAPFALALKATTVQIGLLTSVPNLMMALSQLAAPQLVSRVGSRKALILPAVFLHAVMWLPILLIPYVIPGAKIWWLIAFVTLSTVFGAMANPAWGSLMADLVPRRIRGRYFAARGRISTLVALIFVFIGGGILQITKANGFLGFALIFGGALLFRLISFIFLTKMYEVPAANGPGSGVRLPDLIREIGTSNLGRFTIFVALMGFSANLAAPFFTVYMLRDLHFSYLSFVIVTCSGSVATLLFLTYWGRRADRAGNLRIIRIASFLVPVVPLLWLVSGQIWYLVLVQTFASFAWAGFDLANVNFVYEAAPPEERTRRIALFNAMNGMAVCLGALAGGLLAGRVPPIFGYSLLTIFAISGLLRAIVAALLLRGVHEVRDVPRVGFMTLMFSRPHK
jgi:MFS family permease